MLDSSRIYNPSTDQNAKALVAFMVSDGGEREILFQIKLFGSVILEWNG